MKNDVYVIKENCENLSCGLENQQGKFIEKKDLEGKKKIVFEDGNQIKVLEGFDNLIDLEEIIIGKNVEHIDGFNGCENLKKITFEEGAKCKEIKGFERCNSLVSVVVPKSLLLLEGFEKCEKLRVFIIEDGAKLKRFGSETPINLKKYPALKKFEFLGSTENSGIFTHTQFLF